MLEGPYKLPKGWRWVRLGEVCEIRQGRAVSSKKLQKKGYPVFGANGLIGYWKEYHYEEEQVLIACRGSTCGIINMSLPYSFVNNNAMALVVLDRNKLLKNYLYYVLYYNYLSGQIKTVISGSGQPQITKSALKDYLIPLPPLEEQHRIVARIEELMERVQEARRLQESALTDADRLWQSILGEIFPCPGQDLPSSWRWVRLGEVCEIWDKYRIPVKKKERKSGNIPYCGANGIIDYVEGWTHEGEFVLLAEDGGFYKAGEKSAYIMRGRFWANNHVHILKGKTNFLENLFLMHYLNAIDLTPWLTGATRPKLNQNSMKKIPIPLPPLKEQHHIVAYLDEVQAKITALKKRQEETTTELNRLEQATLDKAFRGEL